MRIVMFLAGMLGLGLGTIIFVSFMNDVNAPGGIIKSMSNMSAWDQSMFEMIPIAIPLAMAATLLIFLARPRRINP